MRRTLAAAGGLLLAVLLSACGNEAGDGTPAPSPNVDASPAQTSPEVGPSIGPPTGADPGGGTVDPADVTDEQKQACLDAMLTQLREKKGGTMPEECAILPNEVVGELVQKALSGA